MQLEIHGVLAAAIQCRRNDDDFSLVYLPPPLLPLRLAIT